MCVCVCFPVHAVKVYMSKGGVILFILNLDISWIWTFSRIYYEAGDNPIESHAIGFKNPKTFIYSTEVQYMLCLWHHTH